MRYSLIAVLLAALPVVASADEREDYYRRAAEADMAAFKSLDLNGDHRLDFEEVRSAVDFAPRFHDIDVNGDGITADEMRRYIRAKYGVDIAG